MDIHLALGATVEYNDHDYTLRGPEDLVTVTADPGRARGALAAHRARLVRSWDPANVAGCRSEADLERAVAGHSAVVTLPLQGGDGTVPGSVWVLADLTDDASVHAASVHVVELHGVYADGRSAGEACGTLGRARVKRGARSDARDSWHLLCLRAVEVTLDEAGS